MKRLCVFCGSSMGNDPAYAAAATEVGKLLAERGIELVYGGGNVGLMGMVARSALEHGGDVIGIIPRSIFDKEVGNPGVTELFVVNSMHERKTMMATLSDGFIALPGGYGTLEEFIEVTTWSQLGFHEKPCILLNINQYYEKLIDLVDHFVGEGFVKANMRELILSADTPTELMHVLDHYEPVNLHKWLDEGDL
jgi:uncharacterized protein (TIGR00730 family)